MRPIKFKGKAVITIEELERYDIPHENGWVTGNLIKNGDSPVISSDIYELIEESIYPKWWVVVEVDSVGQYTGLKDKDSKKIYENDVAFDEHIECFGVVKFDEGKFIYEWENVCEDLAEVHDSIIVTNNEYEVKHQLEVQAWQNASNAKKK